tara:strand:- start:404 stop:1030 length:627 start_codon:yes stop_codon:yes gene_type:complete
MFNPSFLLTFVFNNTRRRFTYAVYSFVLVLMVCSMPQSLFGQTQANIPPAESYFHQGAQQFIYNNLEAAISAVETGLERYPNDLKLQSLYEQLKEQQQQQQDQDSQDEQDNGDQNEENSEQNSEQQENEENSEQNEQNSENDDQSQSQDEQAPDDLDPSERAQAEELKDLSKEEAQKILQALAQKEKELLKEFKKAKTKGGKTHEKDW